MKWETLLYMSGRKYTCSKPIHSPFDCLVDSPPLGVVSLGLKTSPSSFSLLGNIDSARVNDVATFARPQGGVDQLLVFLTPSAIGACQRLPCSHHDLNVEVVKIIK